MEFQLPRSIAKNTPADDDQELLQTAHADMNEPTGNVQNWARLSGGIRKTRCMARSFQD